MSVRPLEVNAGEDKSAEAGESTAMVQRVIQCRKKSHPTRTSIGSMKSSVIRGSG
ncbi:MAG: hypothetical protein H7Y43_06375 [Akkermansiaceae bacterium]|nr:hypothetical protein [Verrucomicrobiales bacterium]